MTRSRPSTRLARPFALLTGATFALVVLGALVRANNAGLACPDWPLCFGALVPAFDIQVLFEWSHRALAGGVSLGLLALTLVLWRRPALRAAHNTQPRQRDGVVEKLMPPGLAGCAAGTNGLFAGTKGIAPEHQHAGNDREH